jgi:hypothetical protein
MPFQFLGEDGTLIEGVSHHHVGKYHYYKAKRSPRNGSTRPFVNRVYQAAQLPDCEHG